MMAQGPGRLLVVGASGLVGSELLGEARRRGLQAVGAARRVQHGATVSLDLQDRDRVDRVLAEVQPTHLALCSAWPHVDGCEQDPARSERENVGTVRNVVDALGPRSEVRLLFFSTDHVFDGADNPYTESAKVNPLSVYARHKRAVEELLLARGKALVARTAWVFGKEPGRKNFVYRVIDAARAHQALKVPRDQAGCPTWSRWLAQSALALWADGLEGVVHLAGERALTKAEWARLIAEALGLPPLQLEETGWAEAGQVAPRPERVVLRSERHTLLHPPLPDVLQAELKDL